MASAIANAISAPLPVKIRFLGLSDTLLTALRTRPDTSIAPRLRHESQMTVTYVTTKQNSARRSTLIDQRQAPLRSSRDLGTQRNSTRLLPRSVIPVTAAERTARQHLRRRERA